MAISFPAKVLLCTFLKDSVKPELSVLSGKVIQERSGARKTEIAFVEKQQINNLFKLSSSKFGWAHFLTGSALRIF